jgi:hypothetical protein
MAVFIVFYEFFSLWLFFLKHGEPSELWRTKYHTSYHTISNPRRKRTSFPDFEVLRSANLQIIGCWKPILFNGRMTP